MSSSLLLYYLIKTFCSLFRQGHLLLKYISLKSAILLKYYCHMYFLPSSLNPIAEQNIEEDILNYSPELSCFVGRTSWFPMKTRVLT